MRITIVDAEGQQEDVGPFDVEVTAEERAALEGVSGSGYQAVLDVLNALDDDRPDTGLRKVSEAFEAFGDTAALEIEG